MRTIKSCGVILFRREPRLAFLTMRQAHRVDFPKGHIEPGESELECALRELQEETGIGPEQVRLAEGFRCVIRYPVRSRRSAGRLYEKTVVYFLGWVQGEPAIRPTEHDSYEWVPWPPPQSLGFKALDEALAAVGQHLATL